MSVAEKIVFDIGLNVGQDTGFYLSQGCKVVAIDADPTLVEAARSKFGSAIQSGRLEVLNIGIGEREGVAQFWICDDKPEFNSFHREIAARDGYAHHAIQVPVVRFGSLIERYGVPHFLKIDIEGNDLLCLDDLSPARLPDYVSLESECPLDEGGATVEHGLRVLGRLGELGYQRFKLIDQFTFCALSSPPSLHQRVDTFARTTLRRRKIRQVPGVARASQSLLTRRRLEQRFGWDFPVGCSGVWGEDTPGKWITRAEAAQAYVLYRKKHFAAPGAAFHSFWCDWHAKR